MRSASPDDETDDRRATAADVERTEAARARDLIIPGGFGHLPRRVEHHAYAGRADGMPETDQSTARIHRDAPIDLDIARLDRTPTLSGRGNSEMIDCHVLGDREAIV